LKTVLGLQADIQQLRTTLRAAAEGKADEMTGQTMELLINIADRVDQRLAQTQGNLEEVQNQINELSQRIAAQKSEILFALNLAAVIATLMYLWLIYSQIVVIGAQVRKLRGERKCPECPEIEGTDQPQQPAPVAAVAAPVEPAPGTAPLPEPDSDTTQSSTSD